MNDEMKRNNNQVPRPDCARCHVVFDVTSKLGQCSSGHLVCWECEERPSENTRCPTCFQPITGRADYSSIYRDFIRLKIFQLFSHFYVWDFYPKIPKRGFSSFHFWEIKWFSGRIFTHNMSTGRAFGMEKFLRVFYWIKQNHIREAASLQVMLMKCINKKLNPLWNVNDEMFNVFQNWNYVKVHISEFFQRVK